MNSTTLKQKSLSILKDQLTHEFIACRKAEYYATAFQNGQLKTLASELATCHRDRYNRLYNYLNSWN